MATLGPSKTLGQSKTLSSQYTIPSISRSAYVPIVPQNYTTSKDTPGLRQMNEEQMSRRNNLGLVKNPQFTTYKPTQQVEQPVELNEQKKANIVTFIKQFVKDEDSSSLILILKWLEVKHNLFLFFNRVQVGGNPTSENPTSESVFDQMFKPIINVSQTFENPLNENVKIIWPDEETDQGVIDATNALDKATLDLFKAEDELTQNITKLQTLKREYLQSEDAFNYNVDLRENNKLIYTLKTIFTGKDVFDYNDQSRKNLDRRDSQNQKVKESKQSYETALRNFSDASKNLVIAINNVKDRQFFKTFNQLPFDILNLICREMFEIDIKGKLNIQDGKEVYTNSRKQLVQPYELNLTLAKQIEGYPGKYGISHPELDSVVNKMKSKTKNDIFEPMFNISHLVSQVDDDVDDEEALIKWKNSLLGNFNINFINHFFDDSNILHELEFLAVLQSIHTQFDYLNTNEGTKFCTTLKFQRQNNTHFFDFYMSRNASKFHVECASRTDPKDTEGLSIRHNIFKHKTLHLNTKKMYTIVDGIQNKDNSNEIKQTMCRYYYTNFLRDLWNYMGPETRDTLHFCTDISFTVEVEPNVTEGGNGLISRLYRKYCTTR